MIKGIHKSMIWVQTAHSRYFEGAYFVVRTQVDRRQPKENEMLREVNRILEEQNLQKKDSLRRRLPARRGTFFALGMLLGCVVCALFAWLIILCI